MMDWREFTARRPFSRAAINNFADHIGIDAGIVVGRLQKDNYVNYSWYNDMKTKYEII